MAEVVGLISGLMTIANAGLRLYQTLNHLADGIKSAEEDITLVALDLKATTSVVGAVRECLSSSTEPRSLLIRRSLAAIPGLTDQCDYFFRRIQDLVSYLEPYHDQGSKANGNHELVRFAYSHQRFRLLDKWKWQQQKPKVDILRSYLESLKSNLSLLLSLLTIGYAEERREPKDSQRMLEELRKALHDASISRKDLDSKVTSSPTPGQSTSLVLVTEHRHILKPQRAIQDLAKELVLWSNANESIRSAKGEEHTVSDQRGDRDQLASEAAHYESALGELEDERPRRVQLVEPPKKKEQESKPKGTLKPPRTVPFPEDPNPIRRGVAPLKEAGKKGIPPRARWTKISRILVNPAALEASHERFEESDEYVVVLRVLTREEIEKFAALTAEIREAREKEWQERRKNRYCVDSSDEEDHPTLRYRSTTASATTYGPQVAASTRQRLPFPNRLGSQDGKARSPSRLSTHGSSSRNRLMTTKEIGAEIAKKYRISKAVLDAGLVGPVLQAWGGLDESRPTPAFEGRPAPDPLLWLAMPRKCEQTI